MRMLFSCLTNADVLDAMRFTEGKKELPQPHTLHHERMIHLLDEHMKTLHDSAISQSSESQPSERSSSSCSLLNDHRQRIHSYCQNAAKGPQGCFQLTVPTGGGKTLSAMRFALEHARIHELDRIIVVIPYLSIIEQNAAVYRQIFDPENQGTVIEHHSSVQEHLDRDERGLSAQTKATDNWDAPMVITTTVQFVESLFSHRPSDCRKLHNIARSVVLLDEVHTLPHHLLDPLLNVLRELTSHYQITIVLSTATQPAFRRSPSLPYGFDPTEVREIIPEPQQFFQSLSRVQCTFDPTPQTWTHLSTLWPRQHQQVLGIVNTKAQARDLYHALAPLDSLIQAAGRCNREGKQPHKGQLIIFLPADHSLPPGPYRIATNLSTVLLKSMTSNHQDLSHPLLSCAHTFADYFSKLFPLIAKDNDNEISLNSHRQHFRYRDVSKKAKVITENTTAVIVPYGEYRQHIDTLTTHFDRHGYIPQKHQRLLQRFMVNLRDSEIATATEQGLLEEIWPEHPWRLLTTEAYHPCLGAIITNPPSTFCNRRPSP